MIQYAVAEVTEAVKQSTVPIRVTGYRLLLEVPEVVEKTEGGIVIPQSRQQDEKFASIVMKVVAVGEDAYRDDRRFPAQRPWCEEGDYVVIKQYDGVPIEIDKKAYRIISDDQILAVLSEDQIGRVGRFCRA